ncbi:MAG TPA: signal peptide peptidase SppA [Planctomycetes bacterium]|nr:signal peptide peptidase SppA [Planctomycetota bacterium]
MDFEETQDKGYTPEHIQGTGPVAGGSAISSDPYPSDKKRPRRSIWRVLLWIMLAFSILANFFLLLMLIAVGVFFAAGPKDFFAENVLRKGSLGNKIATIRVEGIINNQLSEEVRKQIRTAAKDDSVKAMIIRTITPGGTVSASDQIHHEITRFRVKTDKPVVAFMQSIAASGGYYTSVACDKIIAEPTVITGSIGVMSNHFVIKELLESKLGISSVVVKSGPRKNWPSLFEETTEVQKEYLMNKLINPTYERFVGLVNDGRGMLTESEVRELADGSIYGAFEALDNQLIDQIGYLDEAIALAESLAGIENAHVIEYQLPFSLATFLSGQAGSIWNLDTDALRETAVPQLLYLWDGGW